MCQGLLLLSSIHSRGRLGHRRPARVVVLLDLGDTLLDDRHPCRPMNQRQGNLGLADPARVTPVSTHWGGFVRAAGAK